MKKMIALVMLVMLVVSSMPACSTMDPDDKDTVWSAITRLAPGKQSSLAALTRKENAIRFIKEWRMKGKDASGSLICNEGYEDEFTIQIGVDEIVEMLVTWDGIGSLFDAVENGLNRKYREQIEKGTGALPKCHLGSKAYFAVHDAELECPELNEPNARTVEYLLLGAFAVGVLATVAPELLPILCALSVDTYCPDTASSSGGHSVSSSSSGVPAGDAP